MSRINVYTEGDEYDSGTLAGHFDSTKASHWDDSDYNGNGSHGTGRGEGIYRTAQGRWVKDIWSRWQGEPRHACTFIDAEDAREWLLRNHEDEAVTKYFGPIEEERGPGRPEIGAAVHVRLGDDLLAQLDACASDRGQSRAEAVRFLLAEALSAARPYAISFRDISTGLRETDPERYSSLGAAVEALREWQREDRERQQYRGLPSIEPRVERDGRPVDVEAMSE